ncbi:MULTISPECIES: hypothetical protein [unclassified Rhodococcus (in: high G+C Gram-positive bacteria)]|uniref:hypothetical protein n=1 Tax=unclassified Rhodococcus (in: high G+C Gram-positive bacteria) TaxID=192944 RepID=UPI000B9B50FE|nr:MULTISPECIES: hypothetical protein [unclassified Rhodococcus (in: high G+C Gram-positive bacteria)]OZE36132.1 hypothetical protein CH259_13610 [Rhodococcus sp. 05-2254-4]OZE41229.1 hypothetical protein CH261_25005 [Rhodococcus sp. 05-2254-3]OZE44576.1 hypothetical protein CH283_27260 [Rhodococcus sp. 05-2254-2]
MATDKQARRTSALTDWADAAKAVGFEVPSPADILTIAAHPDSWETEFVSSAARDWSATIAHINHQIKFGMAPNEVVRHLPEELRKPRSGPVKPKPAAVVEPAAVPPEAAEVSDEKSKPIDALFAWRANRIADGDAAAASIKDVTFHNLIKYGHTSAAQIRKQLRGPSVSLANSIAEVFAGFDGKEEEAAPEPTITAPESANERPSSTPERAPRRTSHRLQPASEPTPMPEPNSAPAPAASASAGSSVLDGLDHADFCEFNFESTFLPTSLTFTKVGESQRLSWSPHPDAEGLVALYRVVSGENAAPYKPEAGELLGVTTGTTWTDDRFPTSAVRNYQVWCHLGRDNADAMVQQPDKLAQGEAVSPVSEFVLSEDEGRVIGRWSAWSGTRAVRIFRIPLDGASPVSNDPRYQIESHQDNLTGFVDEGVARGQRYLYRALSEVVVGEGTRQSSASQGEILVSVVLEPVDDLTVVPDDHPDKPSFDLTWKTPESGNVFVYRTQTPPDAGLRFAALAESAIEVEGLTRATQLAHPIEAGEAGTSRMRRIPWPTGWDRAYLTPVTILNGSARVGKTTVQTRPIPPVTDAKIVERCATQLVTFGWPKSAASVLAYLGPRNHMPENLLESRAEQEISAAQYKRDGGLTFRTLPPNGCAVHLIPIAYSRGERVTGTEVTLDYPGLIRLRYAVNRTFTANGGIRLGVVLAAENELEPPAPLMLVHNYERLPLSARDGEPLALRDQNDPSGREMRQFLPPRLVPQWTPTGWSADITGRQGYVRLFLDIDPVRARGFAMLDPVVSELMLDPNSGPDR